MSTVAESIVEHLIAAGVERVYGVVGDSLNPIVDAIRRSGGKIQWVHVRHEEAGAFAASAEAQLTGKLAVCAGSCGPGNLHLINGLYDAHRSGVPVLALAAHIPSSEIGTGYFQETHPERIFGECSHYCEHVSTAKQMPRMLQIAMQEAVAKGGVGVIVLSGDVASEPVHEGSLKHGVVQTRPKVRPSDEELDRLAEFLNESERVTIFGGIGCEDAHGDVLALAEALAAPVGHTMRGKSALQHDNPYDVGMNGLLGYGGCYEAMHRCDALLLLGTDWPYEAFYPTKSKIAQVDIRPERLGRRCRLDLGLCGDVGETIRALLPRLEKKADRAFLEKMLDHHAHGVAKLKAYVEHGTTHRPIHPEFAATALDEVASEDAIFTVDTGMCNVWTARYLRSTKGRKMIGSFVHGSMACAMPMAIGAQLAYPGRQVVAVCGDGGFTMLMGDLLTIAQYDLPVKLVIFNNSTLGMVRLEMQVDGYPFYGTEMKNPNFAALAEAVGIRGTRIEDPALVKEGLREALAAPGPALIDLVTDPNALSMPPNKTLDQVKGFALGMGKMILAGDGGEVVKEIGANLRNLV
ncbi:pyruvate dehydrogenase [bacterium]|nr:MAG: pyruvate dehydrogenase [bacterium]